MISIKSDREIELMKEAGRLVGETHKYLKQFIKEGITTIELDRLAEDFIRKNGGIPTEKGYEGYPASICASVNDEVVHGIPTKDHIIDEGDIVSLDAGVIYKGYHSDAARTHAVGEISKEASKLIEVTKESFFEGLKYAKEGNHLFDISRAIQKYVEANGFSVVRDLVGHGIGSNLHEAPEIPNFAGRRKGMKLKAGMTLAIEPMVNAGHYDVCWLDDDWTVVTADGSLSAHYENTVLITEDGYEILSLTK